MRVESIGGPIGSGLISETAYAPGEIIHRLVAHHVMAHAGRYSIQIGLALHLFDPAVQYMNHSCDPSAIIDTVRREVIARKNIQPGDEISFFYPSTEWDMAEPFECRCQAKGCLGVVAGAKHLRPGALDRHWVNPHIRALALGVPSSVRRPHPAAGALTQPR